MPLAHGLSRCCPIAMGSLWCGPWRRFNARANRDCGRRHPRGGWQLGRRWSANSRPVRAALAGSVPCVVQDDSARRGTRGGWAPSVRCYVPRPYCACCAPARAARAGYAACLSLHAPCAGAAACSCVTTEPQALAQIRGARLECCRDDGCSLAPSCWVFRAEVAARNCARARNSELHSGPGRAPRSRPGARCFRHPAAA